MKEEKKMYSCDTCQHNDKNWDELPCDDCTMGGKTHYYEPPDDAETVPRSVFEQFKWERDLAIEQLEQLGYGFGEELRTDGELVKKTLAVRAFAKYLRDMARIDYPDAGGTIRDWMPTAESALKDVPTEPEIIECKDCQHWYRDVVKYAGGQTEFINGSLCLKGHFGNGGDFWCKAAERREDERSD